MLFAWPLALAYFYPDGRLPSARWRPSPRLALAVCAAARCSCCRSSRRSRARTAPSQPARRRHVEGPVLTPRVLGLLGRRAGLAVRRRARAARPLPGGRAGPAAPGPVAGLRRAAAAAVARRHVARRPVLSIDHAPDLAVLMLVHAWLAVAVAVAVTRHGLYAIDRLFNRTLVYALLTALLAGTYALVALLAGLLAGGSAFAGVGRHARRRARVPPAARPPAGRRRPPLRPRPLRGRAAAARLPRRRPRRARASPRTSAPCSRSRSATRAPRCCSACPRPAPTRTASASSSTALPDDGRARTAIGRDERELGVLLHDPALARGPTCCAACSTPPRSRSSSAACASSCASSSPRSSPRARGSPRPATPSGAGSSATSTTARSSGS